MSDFDKNMQDAMKGDSGFDPARTRSAHEEVSRTYQKKLKMSQRAMWIMIYLLVVAAIYAGDIFIMFATTTKEQIASGLIVLGIVVVLIQKTILHGVTATHLMAMKEIKQLRLSLATGRKIEDEVATKPLRGLSRWEVLAWILGIGIVSGIMAQISTRTDRQDDFWRLEAQGRIEAHSAITLRRFPHKVRPMYGVEPPVEGAVLQSATFNGRPVGHTGFHGQYTIQLPYKSSWKSDRIELVWNFPLASLREGAGFHTPLRSVIPVHDYSLRLYIEDNSGYVPQSPTSWKFNKRPEELRNEAEARRTIKLFTQNIRGDAPRDNFGSCGLGIVSRPVG